VLGEPVDRLVAGRRRERLDTGRERPVRRGPVALRDRLGAPAVPRDGEQDQHRLARSLDIAVERAPEPLLVLRRDERIDEDDRVGSLVVDAADLLVPPLGWSCVRRLPFRMETGPAPEARRYFLHVHEAGP
jgi:hypothetical protein